MRTFMHDMRLGIRQMMSAPLVAVTATLALALGIGATTAMFSIVWNVLLQPLPIREPDTAFTFTHFNEKRSAKNGSTPYHIVAEWRTTLKTVDRVAAFNRTSMSLANGGDPERVIVGKADREFFPLLGVPPVLGRGFTAEEDHPNGPRVALISHELFVRRFAADAAFLGKRVLLDGDAYSIIGVLPPRFRLTGERADVWTPLAAPAVITAKPTAVTAIGRRKTGVSEAQMLAEFDLASAREATHTPQYKGWKLRPEKITEWIVPDVKASLWMLLGAVGFLLLIACANVANLLLVRAASRQREMSVRHALGATRSRLAMQMLAENIPMAVLAGSVGLLLAWWMIRALPILDAGRIPRLAEARLDPAVLAFTAAVSVFTCLLFGLAPAILVSRTTLMDRSRSTSSTRAARRARNTLVGAEIAIAFVLCVGAMLMIRTFVAVSQVDPGFRSDNVLTASVELPRPKLKGPEDPIRFYTSVKERLRTLPGVLSAGLTSSLPLGGNYFRGQYQVEGKEAPLMSGNRTVDREYFETLRIPLRKGRLFEAQDTLNAPKVVVINESMARQLFPGEDAIGRRIGYPGFWMTVVGVVADVRQEDVTRESGTEALHPYTQTPPAAMSFVIRLDPALYRDPMQFAPALRRAVAEIAPGQAVFRVAAVDKIMADRLAPRRISSMLLGAFAGLALLLAAIGLYGVLAFAVAQRTQEIGIRMALGARAPDVVRSVMREAMSIAAGGVGAGVLLSFALTRTVRGLLYGVESADPWTFAATATALGCVAATASYLPARRAAHTDPLIALRYE